MYDVCSVRKTSTNKEREEITISNEMREFKITTNHTSTGRGAPISSSCLGIGEAKCKTLISTEKMRKQLYR